MSVVAQSVPPWKQSLIDKKRRQEDENHLSDKEIPMKHSGIPSWKKDLLLKRQGQQNSLVFVGRRKSSEPAANVDAEPEHLGIENGLDPDGIDSNSQEVPVIACENDGENTGTGAVNGQEHLLPVKENPWFRRDHPAKKKRFSDNLFIGNRSISTENIGTHHKSWSGEIGVPIDTTNESDEVFNEEVTYGKGFVHKLLLKFSHISEHEKRGRRWSRNLSTRRSQSAENILDDKSGYCRTSGEFSPRSSYTDTISPRSPSRGSDCVSSPRTPNEVASPRVDADSSYPGTSHVKSQDNNSDLLSNDKSNEQLSPVLDITATPEDELPKKNTVSSTRNVFELITSPRIISTKPALISPKPVTSPLPRNSVHALIAVDTIESDTTSDEPSNLSSADKQQENGVSCNPISIQHEKSKRPELKSSVNNQTDIVAGDSLPDKQHNSSAPKSYFERYVNKVNDTSSSQASSVLLSNGDISSSTVKSTQSENVEIDSETIINSTLKKRKAPPPPKPSLSFNPHQVAPPPIPNSTSELPAAKPPSVVNSSRPVPVPVSKSLDKPVVASAHPKPTESKPVLPKTTNPKPTAPLKSKPAPPVVNSVTVTQSELKRPSLNLPSNDVNKKPEVIKGSSGSRNDAYSVINSNRNKKAKIVTPKSSGPGNLLIRPASNMIQAKNAQFAKLEFKYDDIRTGDFAPAKKKPSYYEDDSESDDDIPVTNIDDVVDGRAGSRGVPVKDRNANIAKKGGKYDFIGAGVLSGKSSLSKKPKTIKLNIKFDEHNNFKYEYPSETSLMLDTAPQPGDYDYIDVTVTNGHNKHRHDDSDDDDDESIQIDIDVVSSSQQSLKTHPAVGSAALSGYQSKMQFEYHFGMNMNDEPAAVQRHDQKAATAAPPDEYIKPADEEETANWSETASADILF